MALTPTPGKPLEKIGRREIVKLARTLQGSEVHKSECGMRLVAWVETNAKAYAPPE